MEAPNVAQLSQASGIASEEGKKLASIPALDQGSDILHAIT
jgi:hypothetical protein